MVTIEIEGMGELELDDSFLDLSPEEQDRTVQEIVAQIKGSNSSASELSKSKNKDTSIGSAISTSIDRCQALLAEGVKVRHLDGNKLNNQRANLKEYGYALKYLDNY